MRYNKFRTALMLLVILLFVGMNFSIIITGNFEKINNISEEKNSNLFSMFTNSLLAYWSFDEGSGSIAYDYSGHDYDGILHGADWIYGHSGYALDFDGVGDYVYMDAHSEDLGFNKSDDYKISLWFNSTSTDSGKIYEISDTDGLPMAYVRLNSDGTLEAEVQTTSSCDVGVYSTNSYNDGLWHFVECIYHGDSSYPTLELYVDQEFVNNDTDWLCPQSSNMFKRAKIGITSYDNIECFDGVIDEVKVYKNPEGNQPPNAPNISGPTSGTFGEEYDYTFVTTDSDGENVFYWIDWGDNYNTSWIGPYNSDEEVIVSHVWSENGIYEIRAKAKDVFDVSEWSDPLLVAMGNLAPDAPSITGTTSGKKGEEYGYTFVSADLNGHNVKYYIDWGDGNTEWTGFSASGTPVTVSHTWVEEDTYTITAKAQDEYGLEGPEGTLEVTMPFNKNIVRNQFWFRIRNRICDTLGICQGGCNLTNITGILEYDETNFFIDGVELHFGPNWYIIAAIAVEDYDGDGEKELVIDELLGLVGTEVTVEGHLQSDGWMSVFTINGMVYREPGQPIWAAQHNWRWRNRHNNKP